MTWLILAVAAAGFYFWKVKREDRNIELAIQAMEDHDALFNKIFEMFDNHSIKETEWREFRYICQFSDERRRILSKRAGINIPFVSLESVVLKIIHGDGEIREIL